MARKLYQISNLYPHLKHPEKYVSTDKTIVCRSGWEITFCIKFLDVNPSVLEWTSESIVIPYLYPLDGRMHRYFVDIWFKCRTSQDTVKEYLVEIKPFAETIPVPKPVRSTKGYFEKVKTYTKNQAKWAAARKYCEDQRKLGRNIEFMIVTEKDGFF